jgi:hypothetical protein
METVVKWATQYRSKYCMTMTDVKNTNVKFIHLILCSGSKSSETDFDQGEFSGTVHCHLSN